MSCERSIAAALKSLRLSLGREAVRRRSMIWKTHSSRHPTTNRLSHRSGKDTRSAVPSCHAASHEILLCTLVFARRRLRDPHRAPPDSATRAAESPVTWSRQIAPIIYHNCAVCHHPGGAGPFSLLSYADARRRAPQILDVTRSRYMPPWLPAPGYGDFADDRRLSDEDLALIRKWVHRECPKATPAEAPPGAALRCDLAIGQTRFNSFTVERPFAFRRRAPTSSAISFFPIRSRRPTSFAPWRSCRAHRRWFTTRTSLSTAQLPTETAPDDWKKGIPGMESGT